MSGPAEEEGGGLPPFWWVWALGAVALLIVASLFIYRFWVLDRVPVPGRLP